MFLVLQPQESPAVKVKWHRNLRNVEILVLCDFSPRQVDFVKCVFLVVELILSNLPLLCWIRTENDLHVSIEECHAVATDRVVMVSLYFLEFVA